MGYPVTLNGRTYTLADFEGQNYVSGFPDALEDFVTDAGAKVTAAELAETNAETAQAAAEAAQTAAEAAQAAAEAAQDAIDGLYLGAQASNPTVDLNGDPLTAGDWYFNTSSNSAVVYDGSAWNTITSYELSTDTTPQLGGTLDANGNTIDMGTNVITDAKVGQWDTAYGWGDHSTAGYLTSYTETDTLDNVTGRGATTTNAVTVGNLTSTGIDDNAASTAITIDSSQNVGIGDSTPANRLQVTAAGTNNAPTLGSISANAQLYLTNSDAAYGLVVGNSSADGHVWMQAQRTDGTATAYNITLNEAGGYVGIGTAAPQNAFVVSDGNQGLEVNPNVSNEIRLSAYDRTNAVYRPLVFNSDSLILREGGTDRVILETGGSLAVNATSAGSSKFLVKGTDQTNQLRTFTCQDGAGTDLFFVRNDGMMRTGTGSTSPYNLTTASAANVYVSSNGTLYRSTSSLRYKTNVQDLPYGLSAVMSIRPVTFEAKDDESGRTFAGFIAEDIHDAGLSEFVEYNDAEEPDALAYGNMVSLLTKAIQEQQAMIEELQSQVRALISG